MRRLAPILAVLAVLLTGCASSTGFGSSPALRVGNWTLSQADLADQVKAVNDFQATSSAAPSTTLLTYPMDLAASVLTVHARDQLLGQALDARGLTVTDQDLQTASQQLSSQGLTADQLTQLGDFGKAYVEMNARMSVLTAALASTPDDATLQAAYDQTKDQYADGICLSFILVAAGDPNASAPPTQAELAAAQAEAQGYADQARAGTPFAQLASAHSADPQSAANGGDVGCITRDQLQGSPVLAAIDGLQAGGIADPIPYQSSGYLVIKVNKLGQLTFDEAKSQVKQAVSTALQQQAQQELTSLLSGYEVSVDARYGTWDSSALQVVPPEGPTQPTTPTADTATTVAPAAAAGG